MVDPEPVVPPGGIVDRWLIWEFAKLVVIAPSWARSGAIALLVPAWIDWREEAAASQIAFTEPVRDCVSDTSAPRWPFSIPVAAAAKFSAAEFS